MLDQPAMRLRPSRRGRGRNGHPKEVHRQHDASQREQFGREQSGSHHNIQEGNPHANSTNATISGALRH
jgi:hypothetical protein